MAELPQNVRCSIVRPCLELAQRTVLQSETLWKAASHSEAKDDALLGLFKEKWFLLILQAAAQGHMVMQIKTDFPPEELARRSQIEEFFEGTGFRIVRFEPYRLHPKFAVLAFFITWAK